MRDILVVLMEGKAALLKKINVNIHCLFIVLPFLSVYLLSSSFVFSIYVSGTPVGVSYSEVRDGLLAVEGVTAVHNLHIWALTVNQALLSAHVAIGKRKLPNKNTYIIFSLNTVCRLYFTFYVLVMDVL